MDDDENDDTPSRMMEMSQDCIGWDESRNRDLRELAISPTPQKNADGTNKKDPRRLDGVKRRLAEGILSPEEEVNAVFKLLEQQEGSSEATQQAGNPRSVRQRLNESYIRPPRTNSLASRRRKKLMEHQRNNSGASSADSAGNSEGGGDMVQKSREKRFSRDRRNERRRRVTTCGSEWKPYQFHSPVPNTTNARATAAYSSGGGGGGVGVGAFEELLKEFSTPQSEDGKSPTRGEVNGGGSADKKDDDDDGDMSPPKPMLQSQNSISPQQLLSTQPITPPTRNTDSTSKQTPHPSSGGLVSRKDDSSMIPTPNPPNSPHPRANQRTAVATAINTTFATGSAPSRAPLAAAPAARPIIANAYRKTTLPKPAAAKENALPAVLNSSRGLQPTIANRRIIPGPGRQNLTNTLKQPLQQQRHTMTQSINPYSKKKTKNITAATQTTSRPPPPLVSTSAPNSTNNSFPVAKAPPKPMAGNVNTHHHHQQQQSIESKKKNDASMMEEEEDDFGDFDFGDDVMANLDNLLSMRSSTEVNEDEGDNDDAAAKQLPVATTKASIDHARSHLTTTKPMIQSPTEVDEFGSLPHLDLDALDALEQQKPRTTATTTTSVKQNIIYEPHSSSPSNNSEEDEFGCLPPLDLDAIDAAMTQLPRDDVQQDQAADEFGDFPELDFDAMDQAIVKRSTQDPHDASMGCHLPMNAPIRNPRREGWNQEDSYIDFARYKVIDVVDDTTSYTKTLSVAVWTDEMRKEIEKEKDYHRDCQVTIAKAEEDIAHQTAEEQGKRTHKYKPDGLLHLRGEWYYTPLEPGDIVHLCSLSGKFRTDSKALPIILHNPPPQDSDYDDLVLVIHPDILMIPTSISETVTCSRRAVLKSRIGSTGLTAKAPLFGTMRHELFGLCLRENKYDMRFAKRAIRNMVRENAEGLLGCGVSTLEAQQEVLKVVPIIQNFVGQYSNFGKEIPDSNAVSNAARIEGNGYQSNIKFLTHKVHSIEEPIVSPELALKGNIDGVLEAATVELEDKPLMPNETRNPFPQNSLMCLELKTGHNQRTQNAHMAQLALYTLMLQTRYGSNRTKLSDVDNVIAGPAGAAAGGLLLYLNAQGIAASHVSPFLNETKSLLGQRNVVASGLQRSSRPRGIVLSYDDGNRDENWVAPSAKLLPPPPAVLPEVLPSPQSGCERCYMNRECMVYAATEPKTLSDPNWAIGVSHAALLSRFIGQLHDSDLDYFRNWDRLIDVEADASNQLMTTAWLSEAQKREREGRDSVSGLIYVQAEPDPNQDHVLLTFQRAPFSLSQSPLDDLALSKGSHVVVSTDTTSLVHSSEDRENRSSQNGGKRFRNRMHVLRGVVEEVHFDRFMLLTGREDLERMRDLTLQYKKFCRTHGEGMPHLCFRFDKDSSSVGITTLRQNLINFLTADYAAKEGDQLSQVRIVKQTRLPRLRDLIVRLTAPGFHEAFTLDSIFTTNAPRLNGCDMKALSTEFSSLNSDQKDAVVKVVSASDYTLLQGLPGTGKTTTLAFIARLLAARGKRVLIASYTHSAVDNVVMKLMEKGVGSVDASCPSSQLIRIGKRSSCHQAVRSLIASELALEVDRSNGRGSNSLTQTENYQNFKDPSVESLRKVVSSARIVCASALSVPRSPLLTHENFDVVIIDEAGQISQPAILGVLVAADSFVLVGDHKQLPPLVNSQIAETGGYGVSMLQRLAEKHPKAIATLTYQYRMNSAICRLSSEAVYGGRLKCGNEAVKSRALQLQGFPKSLPKAASAKAYPWLRAVVDPMKSVVFVDTDNVKKSPRQTPPTNEEEFVMEPLESNVGGKSGGNVINRTEVSLVSIIIAGLVSCGVSPENVGVICPFRAQLRIFEEETKMCNWKKQGLELSTIDRYQGRDKEVIILSTVRSNSCHKVGRLLADMRRMNVALTRAKSKLIIVGSFSTLSNGSKPLKPLLARVNRRGQRFLLPEDAVKCYNL